MKVLIKPNKKNAGIGIYKKEVYHFLSGNWIVCGDCKISDKRIRKFMKKKNKKK